MNYMIHMMNEADEDVFIFSEEKEDVNIKDFEDAGFKIIGVFEIKLIDGKDDLPEISEPEDADEGGDEKKPTEAEFQEISGDGK